MDLSPIAVQYKDTVFRHYFNDKQRLLSLYAALTGDEGHSADEIEITTLAGTIGSNMKNDISFKVGERFVVLFEHQSSWNENMPLRCLLYLARLWLEQIEQKELYKSALKKLPAPLFFIFYNGKDKKMPPIARLKLSDAYNAPSDMLELFVDVYDIRYGVNDAFLAKCQYLHNYSFFVAKVDDLVKSGLPKSEAIRRAMRYCIERGVMDNYLREHEMEVYDMLSFEYDADLAKQVYLEEGMEKGLAKGMEKGREEGAASVAIELLKAGSSVEFVSRMTKFSADKIRELGKVRGLL